MQVLVTGANGFIGSAIVARLRALGHIPVRVSRSDPTADVRLDMARAIKPAQWLPHLQGVDAVVNCAGVLQDGARESTEGVHVTGAAALFRACEQQGIRKLIHFSAIGVDRGGLSDFSRTKLAGDEALMETRLDWVILRPSVVLGPGAAGAGALIRGLAALPLLPVMPNTGPIQVVQIEDVLDTVIFFLTHAEPSRVALEVVGPERLAFEEAVARYRAWMGWSRARIIRLPDALSRLFYLLGDAAGALGWRTAIRSTARKEMVRGAVGDPARWTKLTGIAPRPLDEALATRAALPQERLFARFYFLKPVVFAVFSTFWIGTGIVSLGPGFEKGLEYLHKTAIAPIAMQGVVAGALADIVIGVMIAYRPTARAGLWGAVAISLFYAVAGTLLLPELWNDPLGPMLKIWPILVLNITAFALLDDR